MCLRITISSEPVSAPTPTYTASVTCLRAASTTTTTVATNHRVTVLPSTVTIRTIVVNGSTRWSTTHSVMCWSTSVICTIILATLPTPGVFQP